jgi:AcrR family transcriptional regulator
MAPPKTNSPRRRTESAEGTRRRIVEATFALHAEQGIAATSMKQIAARAGVSIGAVYHHFPTYDDAIQACGAYSHEIVPLPSRAIFEGLKVADERLQRLASEVFTWFERMPAFEHVRRDQDRLPILRPFVDGEEQNRIALMREALQPLEVQEEQVLTAAALLDLAVYRALRRSGFDTADAGSRITQVILSWLGNSCSSAEARG